MTDNLAKWLELQHARLREYSHKADQAQAEYRQAEVDVNAELDSKHYVGEQRRAALAINSRLNDAQGVWSFWKEEANRVALAIIAEKAIRDMLPYWQRRTTG